MMNNLELEPISECYCITYYVDGLNVLVYTQLSHISYRWLEYAHSMIVTQL